MIKQIPLKFNIYLTLFISILALLLSLIIFYPLMLIKLWNLVYFYFLPANIIFLALFVYLAKEPIHSLFCLIGVFINIIFLFLSFKVEFLALLLLIIYVGAVAILFLFVIMMFNLSEHLSQKNIILWKEEWERSYSIFFIAVFYAYLSTEINMKSKWIDRNKDKKDEELGFELVSLLDDVEEIETQKEDEASVNNELVEENDILKDSKIEVNNELVEEIKNKYELESNIIDHGKQIGKFFQRQYHQHEIFLFPATQDFYSINDEIGITNQYSNFSLADQIMQVVWADIEPSYKKNMIYNIANEFNDVSLFSNFLYMHNSYLFLLSSLLLLTSMLVALALTTSAKIKTTSDVNLLLFYKFTYIQSKRN